MKVPNNGWFITETPIEMDDLGLHPFQESSTFLSNICQCCRPIAQFLQPFFTPRTIELCKWGGNG